MSQSAKQETPFSSYLRIAAWALGISVLAPYFVERRGMYTQLWTNRPSNIQELNAFQRSSIKFQNIVRNCEDAVLDEEKGIVYLSCDPGRDRWNVPLGLLVDSDWKSGSIYSLDYTDPAAEPKQLVIAGYHSQKYTPATFHPLGVALHSSKKQLYVVNHSNSSFGHGTVDLLQLDPSGISATHLKTLNNPLMYTPNSVAPISENEILFTNDHGWSQQHEPWLSTLETYLALPLGSLVYLNHETGESRKLADIPFANGVAILNLTHLAVASTLVPAVHIYRYAPNFSKVTLIQKLRPKFAVDNLKLDSDGKLLMAGHPHSIACDIVAKTNKQYDLDGEDVTLKSAAGRNKAPSGAAEWDGNPKGELKYLYVSNDYGLSTTIVRDVKRKWGAVVGLYEKGILTFKP